MEREKLLIKFCDFLTHVMGPETEVVLHDREGFIIWIAQGHITGREVGQQDLLPAMEMVARQRAMEGFDYTTGYKSFSRKGTPLRSSSLFFRDEEGRLDYILCVNQDISAYVDLQQMLDAIPTTHKVYINTTFPVQEHTTLDEMVAFTERNKDKITCMNISRHLVKYVEESPDEVLGQIACPTRINCVLYKKYPAEKLPQYVERFLPYGIPIQFRYDYTETTPENLYDQDHDPILRDLKRLFTYRGLDGCRMRNGFHFAYKGLHLTYHKTLPYSTIVEKGEDGVTYDILYDVLIKQNGEIHSDWTGVKMDVDAYRKVVYEPYDLHVINGTIDF